MGLFVKNCLKKFKNVNPIIDYNSFEYYAYNAKLYFESALHFADDAEIRKHAEFYKEFRYFCPNCEQFFAPWDIKEYVFSKIAQYTISNQPCALLNPSTAKTRYPSSYL